MPDAVLIQMIPPDIQARSKIGLACSGTIDIPAYVPNPNTPVDSNFSRTSSRGGDLLITTFVSSKSVAATSICSDCQSCSKTAYLRSSIGGSLVIFKSADIRRCSQAAVLVKKIPNSIPRIVRFSPFSKHLPPNNINHSFGNFLLSRRKEQVERDGHPKDRQRDRAGLRWGHKRLQRTRAS